MVLAQPPKKPVLNTQCPAVSTVLGPMNHPVPRVPRRWAPHPQRADHPPRGEVRVEDPHALVAADHGLEWWGVGATLAPDDEVAQGPRDLARRGPGTALRRPCRRGRSVQRLQRGHRRRGLGHRSQLDHVHPPR